MVVVARDLVLMALLDRLEVLRVNNLALRLYVAMVSMHLDQAGLMPYLWDLGVLADILVVPLNPDKMVM